MTLWEYILKFRLEGDKRRMLEDCEDSDSPCYKKGTCESCSQRDFCRLKARKETALAKDGTLEGAKLMRECIELQFEEHERFIRKLCEEFPKTGSCKNVLCAWCPFKMLCISEDFKGNNELKAKLLNLEVK